MVFAASYLNSAGFFFPQDPELLFQIEFSLTSLMSC